MTYMDFYHQLTILIYHSHSISAQSWMDLAARSWMDLGAAMSPTLKVQSTLYYTLDTIFLTI